MLNLGIDLGTTFSLVSHVNQQGLPTLFPDSLNANEFRTSSLVTVGERSALIGRVVDDLLHENPLLPHSRFFKLHLGNRDFSYLDEAGRRWSAIGLSALVLKKLLRDVEAFASEEIASAVITVPANFTDRQRKSTKLAAKLAGLDVVQLIEEPVAAATFYGLGEKGNDRRIFVYDFGGGTFDATILHNESDGLHTVSTDGDATLGGKVIDEKLIELAATAYRMQHGVDIQADPAANVILREFAEETKIKFSSPAPAHVRRTLFVAGRPLDALVTRAQFEAIVKPVIDATFVASERCLAQANLSWKDLSNFFLVGGSALQPLVAKTLAARAGRHVDQLVTKQPHQAVAFGAALIGQQLFSAAAEERRQFFPAAPYTLGIRVRDPVSGRSDIQPMIKRNTPVPASVSTTFYTARVDQARIIIDVVQAGADGEIAQSLGYFAFGPIEKPRKNYPIEIQLSYDAEGMVTVRAKDPQTGKSLSQIMNNEEDIDLTQYAREKDWISELRIND